MTIDDAIRLMHDSNNRLERHLAEDGPRGPGAYNPPTPSGAGFPNGPRQPIPNIRHLTDHEKVLAGLYRLKGRAERNGHTASRAIYAECIRMLGGMNDPYDATLPGIGERRR